MTFLLNNSADIKSAATLIDKNFIDEMRTTCAELKGKAQKRLSEVLGYIESKL